MAYEKPPTEDGTIFLQKNNSQNPKAPQYKGEGKDDQGRAIEVAYWEGTSQGGKAWKRLKIGPPYQRQGGQGQSRHYPNAPEQPDRNVSNVPAGNKPEETEIPF
jgi:hypothetical protein